MEQEMTDHERAVLAKLMVEEENSAASWQLCKYAERHGPAAHDLVMPFTAALRSLETRDPAAFGLTAIGAETHPAVPELIAAMQFEPDNYCINPFVGALGAIGSLAKEAIPELLVALRSSREDGLWDIVRDTAEALGKIGAKEAVPHLRELLDPNDPPVREGLVGDSDPAPPPGTDSRGEASG